MSEAPRDEDRGLARFDEIRRLRAILYGSAFVSAQAISGALFIAFVFGHQRGPTPLRSLELLLGASSSILLGLALALPLARRRLDARARFVLGLTEGRERRRVAVHWDHVIVDGDVILFAWLEDVLLEGNALSLRYTDPRIGGPSFRELCGDAESVRRLSLALHRGLAMGHDPEHLSALEHDGPGEPSGRGSAP